MKNYPVLLFAAAILGLPGCAPNLVVRDATIDFSADTVTVSVENVGRRNAGQHLTYIEINQVGAPHSLKPQSQYSANVSGIPSGGLWNSGPINFSSFSSRGLNLSALTTANLVVRADAKNMVKESNEGDNVYDVDH